LQFHDKHEQGLFHIIKPTRCTNFSNLFWNETALVSFQNKFEKLVHLVGFIIWKFVTMHGHMNVKYEQEQCEAFTEHNFLQLSLIKMTEIKNLHNATPGLVISQLSLDRKQAYMRKFNPALCTKH
jgi:hypothetical protein